MIDDLVLLIHTIGVILCDYFADMYFASKL